PTRKTRIVGRGRAEEPLPDRLPESLEYRVRVMQSLHRIRAPVRGAEPAFCFSPESLQGPNRRRRPREPVRAPSRIEVEALARLAARAPGAQYRQELSSPLCLSPQQACPLHERP